MSQLLKFKDKLKTLLILNLVMVYIYNSGVFLLNIIDVYILKAKLKTLIILNFIKC